MDLKLFRFLVRDEEVEKSLMLRGATTDILRETLMGFLIDQHVYSMERIALKNNRME